MDSKTFKFGLVAACMMAAAALALGLQKDPVTRSDIGIRRDLPKSVGEYNGSARLFCQNEQCPNSLRSLEDTGGRVCPLCSHTLDRRSLAERKFLPDDTFIERKQYTAAEGARTFLATIVTTGSERRSIHRPEQCLRAQGYSVETRRTISVPLPDGNGLQITVLELRGSEKPEKGLPSRRLALAYWFVSGERETPDSLTRIFWTSYDRVLRNENPQWAYITVAADRWSPDDDAVGDVSRFIGNLYPLISLQGQAARSRH